MRSTPIPHFTKACLGLALFVLPLLNAATVVETHGDLSVNGNRIVNKDDQAVSFAGVSLFWGNNGWGGERYYRENTVAYLQENWNATIVRAAMGVDESGGYISDGPGNQAKVETIVDAAIKLGMYVIIDWHSHHAEDYEAEAVDFFEAMATKYGDTPNVIYEIYNEPLNTTDWATEIKPYSETVIAAIRAIDPDNLIIVGTSSWSQNVDEASSDPITGYDNIAYTLHFYAGTHTQSLRNRATTALNNGIALMVTEWGSVDASGDGAIDAAETERWMDFIRDNQLSHCNWSFNDKNESASILKPGTEPTLETWPDSSLTPSGILVKEIVLAWDETDYDTPGANAFNDWLAENELPDNSQFEDDPYSTGRSLFHDFAFGINPATINAESLLEIRPVSKNSILVRYPTPQPSVEYTLRSSENFESWTEETKANGNEEWTENEIDQTEAAHFYKVEANK